MACGPGQMAAPRPGESSRCHPTSSAAAHIHARADERDATGSGVASQIIRPRPDASARADIVFDSLIDLEEPIREVRYMASIANLLIAEHIHQGSGGMFELSNHEASRLVFATGRASDMAVKLDEQFAAAFKTSRRPA